MHVWHLIRIDEKEPMLDRGDAPAIPNVKEHLIFYDEKEALNWYRENIGLPTNQRWYIGTPMMNVFTCPEYKKTRLYLNYIDEYRANRTFAGRQYYVNYNPTAS